MQIQKINSAQPSFSAKLRIDASEALHNGKKMIEISEIDKLIESAKSYGTDKDELTLRIGGTIETPTGPGFSHTLYSYEINGASFIKGKYEMIYRYVSERNHKPEAPFSEIQTLFNSIIS